MSGPDIAIVGWPRSGTTWLQRLLEDCLGMKVGKPHALPDNPRDRRYVFTTRDPRDALVSVYFFHLHHHGEHLGQTRENLTILEYMKRYFMVGGRYMGNLDCGWAEYHKRWMSLVTSDRLIAVTSHELLMKDREYQLSRILEKLGATVSDDRFNLAIGNSLGHTRWSYIDKDKLVPAGIAGEWKPYLSEREHNILKQYCGDVARQLGYTL